MKYVLDSSVAFKWELSEVNSDKADALRADFRNGVHELLAPDIFTVEVALLRAIDISSKMRIGVYDCVYVVLADREKCEFLTADNTLIKNLGPTFSFIVPLSSLP